MFEGLFTSVLAQTVFVFILIFSAIFGILQKSKIFGEAKQVNALVSLAISLLAVSVGYALDLITKLIPIFAVGLVLILILLLLSSFFYEKEFKPESWMKFVVMALVLVAMIIAVVYFTGFYSTIAGWFSGEGSSWVGNIILIIVVVIVFLIAFFGKEK